MEDTLTSAASACCLTLAALRRHAGVTRTGKRTEGAGSMDEKLSRERLIELLQEVADLKISARKALSTGVEPFPADPKGDLVLTRSQLEALITSQRNINIYAFHSSGINNLGNHSSN
jgi:hypothetical protein